MNNRDFPEQLFEIGIKCIMKIKDGLYLCLTSQEWYYDLPGGRVAEGEEYTDTLRHEVLEEIGISPESYTVAPERHILWMKKFVTSHPQKPRLTLIACPCEFTVENPTIQLSHEHTAFSWETAVELYKKVDILQLMNFEEIF